MYCNILLNRCHFYLISQKYRIVLQAGMSVLQKIEYEMQRISVNVKNDCDGNQLNFNNDLPAIGNKNYALQKSFETDFLTVIGNAKLRPSFVMCWVAQGSRPRCDTRHSIFHSNIFFYFKLFATIILSWNLLKCILWYLLELSDPFIENESSVLAILIEKNFERKIYFCLENEVYLFLKKENPILLLNLDRNQWNHFLNFM